MSTSILMPLLVGGSCLIAAGLLAVQRKRDERGGEEQSAPNAGPWLRLAGLGALASTVLWLPPGLFRWIGAGIVGSLVLVVVAVVWRDLAARIVLWLEGTAHQGMYVTVDGVQGVIDRVGWRRTALSTPEGNRLWLPNRVLVRDGTKLEPGGSWEVTIVLETAPGGADADLARTIEHAARVCPWRVLDSSVSVNETGPTRWEVRMRLLDRRFEKDARRALELACAQRSTEARDLDVVNGST